MTELRVFGPPGTGKTTYLAAQVNRAAQKYGASNVWVSSFTRAAAAEIGSRGLTIPTEMCATLHAHAYRSLGRPEVAESHLKEWNAAATDASHHLSITGADVDDAAEAIYASDADEIAARYQTYRAMMRPRELWEGDVRHFAERWEDWKRQNEYIDFTDMIELALNDVEMAPNEPSIGFVDEAQDLTPLELALVRKWGQHMDYIVMAGDDDQCQPAGTRVLTANRGEVPIEDLDPEKDRLVSYDRAGSYPVGFRSGYAFQIASRLYDDQMYSVTAAGRPITRATKNHRWLVQWADAAKAPNVIAVYLMQQGTRFRVGWCQLFKADGGFHLGVRARLEQADRAWILTITDSRTSAFIMEQLISVKFGIPTVTFHEVYGSQHVTQSAIDAVFYQLGDLTEKAKHCLFAYGRDIEYALYEKNSAQQGDTSQFVTQSCNLLSGYMKLPLLDEKHVVWCLLSVEKDWAQETVYSLNVDRHHLYIADGYVTHNSIYAFKGATPDAFLDPPLPASQKRVLAQSYRIPLSVHTYAEDWVRRLSRREPKTYRPRDFEGAFRQLTHPSEYGNLAMDFEHPHRLLADAQQYLDRDASIMFLGTCAYMLDPLVQELREQGIPFHNPYRRKNGRWNPMHPSRGVSAAQRLATWMKVPSEWTPHDVKVWAAHMSKPKVFVRGTGEKTLETIPGQYRPIPQEYYTRVFTREFINGLRVDTTEYFESLLLDSKRGVYAYPLTVLHKSGIEALTATPLITLGTIHSVKGGEADAVYLFPDLSRSGQTEYLGRGRDSTIRQIYVGLTRCREALCLTGPAGPMYVQELR